jgi:hypothetical protein
VSSRGRRFPLTQRCVGKIDLAGCCTNTMRRQHDGTEFVHPSANIASPLLLPNGVAAAGRTSFGRPSAASRGVR